MSEIKMFLQDYLRMSYPHKKGLKIELIEMNQGWETELKRLDIKYKSKNSHQMISQVIRMYPSLDGKEKARKEYHLMQRLNTISYPTPKVYLIESTGEVIGNPFITMEYIHGGSLANIMRMREEEVKSVRTMMGLLVKLHDIDPRTIYPNTRLTTTQQTVDKYIDFHQSFMEETGCKLLIPVTKWLRERRNKIHGTSPSVLHGDYHANNILIRGNEQPIVIDWGASKIGDPREDLSWTMLLHSIYGDPQAGTKLLESYRTLSNRPMEDIDYFMVIAAIRRLGDMLLSKFAGSEVTGMRAETLELMKADQEEYLKAYSILKDLTGLKLEELHSYLTKM